MKPCDCRSIYDTKNLNEQGIQYNNTSILIIPPLVEISSGNCTMKISQKNFERFAKWYLEDQ
jgi:hypothetical protein